MSNRRKIRGKDWEPLSRQIRGITDGRETQLRAEIEQTAPGFADQLAAATADSARSNEQFRQALAAGMPARYGEADARNVPQQLTDQVTGLYLRVITELAKGERTHCRHITFDAPVPAVACVFANWIYCRTCFARHHPGRPALTEREEHTCDLCGTYRPGQTMDALYPQVGPVLLIIGICPACRARLNPAVTRGAH